MSTPFKVVIPARYASSRLPGKPLLELAGKPMLQHTFMRAGESAAAEIIIATDDSRIEQAAGTFGARVCMTSERHESGTERLAEVVTGNPRDAAVGMGPLATRQQLDEAIQGAVRMQNIVRDLKTFSRVDDERRAAARDLLGDGVKNERPGRNPKTGEEIPISARRVVTFRSGQKLKARVEAYAGSEQ